jgi:hypothetical protein
MKQTCHEGSNDKPLIKWQTSVFVDNTGSEMIILLATKWNIYYHWDEQNEFKHFTPGKKKFSFLLGPARESELVICAYLRLHLKWPTAVGFNLARQEMMHS